MPLTRKREHIGKPLQMSGGYVELRKGLPYNGLDTVGAYFMHPKILAVTGCCSCCCGSLLLLLCC